MKRNVLIIEDNKACMEALAELTRKCETAGAIFCVDNSADAYKYAMEVEIDLFIVITSLVDEAYERRLATTGKRKHFMEDLPRTVAAVWRDKQYGYRYSRPLSDCSYYIKIGISIFR